MTEPTFPAQGSPLERMVRALEETFERKKSEARASIEAAKRDNDDEALAYFIGKETALMDALCTLRPEREKRPNVPSSAAAPGERSNDVR